MAQINNKRRLIRNHRKTQEKENTPNKTIIMRACKYSAMYKLI